MFTGCYTPIIRHLQSDGNIKGTGKLSYRLHSISSFWSRRLKNCVKINYIEKNHKYCDDQEELY